MTSQVPEWASVVYGRTGAADSWWQAAPPGADTSGWLARFVYPAFASGRELEGCPRFLIGQDAHRRIVGVACQARELSEQMCSDGQRELSCFIGWVADWSSVAASPGLGGPALEDFRQQYARWAAPVYEAVMTPVWNLPHSPFRHPAETVPSVPPWDRLDCEPQYDLSRPVPHPGEGLWPAATWPALWTAVLAATDPLTCVVGWPQARSARRDGITHLGADDAPDREEPLVPARLITVPAPEPTEASEPADDLAAASEPLPVPTGHEAGAANDELAADHEPAPDQARRQFPAVVPQVAAAAPPDAWPGELTDALLRAIHSRLITMSRRARIGAGMALVLIAICIVAIIISIWP